MDLWQINLLFSFFFSLHLETEKNNSAPLLLFDSLVPRARVTFTLPELQ